MGSGDRESAYAKAQQLLEFDHEDLVDLTNEMLGLIELHDHQLRLPGFASWVAKAQARLLAEEEHRKATSSIEDAMRWARTRRQKRFER